MDLNMPALLLAIAMVESGNDPNAVGMKGEVTAYQITPKVWKKYTKVPFKRAARNPLTAHYVAKQHILSIQEDLKRILPQQTENPYFIAAVWNGGTRAILGMFPKGVEDYSHRVFNLYWYYTKDPIGIKALKVNAPTI